MNGFRNHTQFTAGADTDGFLKTLLPVRAPMHLGKRESSLKVGRRLYLPVESATTHTVGA